MSKYKSKWTEYNGRKYQSALESTRAQQLDLLKKAGKVYSWHPQYKVELHTAYSKNGEYYLATVCNYFIDFRVLGYNNEGKLVEWYEEVKGKWTEVAKIKHKWLRLQHPNWDVRVLTKREIG